MAVVVGLLLFFFSHVFKVLIRRWFPLYFHLSCFDLRWQHFYSELRRTVVKWKIILSYVSVILNKLKNPPVHLKPGKNHKRPFLVGNFIAKKYPTVELQKSLDGKGININWGSPDCILLTRFRFELIKEYLINPLGQSYGTWGRSEIGL